MGQVEQAFAVSNSYTGEINRRGAYGSRRNLHELDAVHSFDDSSKESVSVDPADPLGAKVASVAQRLSHVDEKLERITAALTRRKGRA